MLESLQESYPLAIVDRTIKKEMLYSFNIVATTERRVNNVFSNINLNLENYN